MIEKRVRARARLATALFAVLVIAAAPGRARGADWLVETVDPDFPDDRTTWLYKGSKVRVEGLVDGLVFLVDLETGEGHVLSEAEGLVAGGSMEEIRASLHGSAETAPGGDGEDQSAAPLPPMRVEHLSPDGEVAGYRAEHRRILLGDLLVEEVWIAPGIGPLTEGPGGSLLTILETMTGGGAGSMSDFPGDYEELEGYREVLRGGYPVKRVRYYRGEENIDEAVRAVEKNLPPALFTIPPGTAREDYRRVFFGPQ